MAGQPGRSGGFRPTADQNNPANVSGTGGAGQQGAKAYKGMPYGQGQALMQQQQSAAMAGPAPTQSAPMANLKPVTSITAPTEFPEQPVTDGAALGAGRGPEALALPQQDDDTNFNAAIDSYYPVLAFINSRPETSAETRRVLSILMRGRG
jgi:hypothetical protein